MKLQVEQETTEHRQAIRWRWTCSCGKKGNWQNLSETNSYHSGMTHMREVHHAVVQNSH